MLKNLICPECQTKLTIKKTNYSCKNCGRDYPFNNGVSVVLPSSLEQNKLNEEKVWISGEHEGIDQPAWLALIHKQNEILYFHEQILPHMQLSGRVLDLGAGSCWAGSLIKSRFPDVELTACDVAPSALHKGKEVSQLLHSSIDYLIACDSEKLPFEDNYFDFIFGSAILHHFLNPEKGISEIYRVLKNGGKYIGIGEILSGKFMGAILKSRMARAGEREFAEGVKENVYTYKEWEGFFNSAGFVKINISLEKGWKYKTYDWFTPLYYRAIGFLPDSLVRNVFPCQCNITAEKKI